MRRHAWVAALLVSGAAIAQTTPPPRPAPAKPAALSLEQQDIRAQLAPRNYTTLAAEIGAKISRITVKPGQSFKSGQMLVSLDCSLQQAQRARAQAELDGAQKTHAVNKRLQELDAVGKLEYATSEQSTLKARAELDSANASLAKCRITAPFSGRRSQVTLTSMRLLILAFLALQSLHAADFHATTWEGIYPRHLQGICTNDKDA